MIVIRGKDVLSRRRLRARLIATNAEMDGPWEPCVETHEGGFAWVGHDPEGRNDIHLPGDGEPFNVDAAVAKLLIAPVVEEP